ASASITKNHARPGVAPSFVRKPPRVKRHAAADLGRQTDPCTLRCGERVQGSAPFPRSSFPSSCLGTHLPEALLPETGALAGPRGLSDAKRSFRKRAFPSRSLGTRRTGPRTFPIAI